ncbi:MAG: divalent-cation tolerance protein CutA [Thaumarchaeota archaeon]|nr:divalent-cation tolerance protein CutA [Nitrososphaerota archaeon]
MAGRLVFTTYPDEETASKEAKRLVEQREAACANIFKVRSIYTWKDKIEETDESIVIFKTTSRKASKLMGSISSKHPYDVPELIQVAPSKIGAKYLKWLTESTK